MKKSTLALLLLLSIAVTAGCSRERSPNEEKFAPAVDAVKSDVTPDFMSADGLIRRTGNMTLEITDFMKTSVSIHRTIEEHDGRVIEEKIYRDDGSFRADLLVRVPSEKFNAFLGAVSVHGEITGIEIEARDLKEDIERAVREERERQLMLKTKPVKVKGSVPAAKSLIESVAVSDIRLTLTEKSTMKKSFATSLEISGKIWKVLLNIALVILTFAIPLSLLALSARWVFAKIHSRRK